MDAVRFTRPTLARYRSLFVGSHLSVIRLLGDERMTQCSLTGNVLDFGGGARTKYRVNVPRWAAPGQTVDYRSANIDPKIEPTYLLRIGEPLPLEAGSHDAVVSLNTLEHVYNLDETLGEFVRILKPDGRLVVLVPFMFRVHGQPDDYRRGTPSFWRRKLGEAGFEEVVVEAITWGPFSTGHSASGLPGPFKSVRRHVGLLLDILLCTYRYRGITEVAGRDDDPLLSSPLGYFIEARKALAAQRSAAA